MDKRLIGTGTTNSEGITSIPYEATGAGKVQICAESNSHTSNIITIYDCKFLDKATINNNNPSWSYNTSYVSRTVEEDGTTVICENTEPRVYSSKDKNNSYNSWNAPVTIEFDIISASANTRFQLFQNSSNSSTLDLTNYGFNDGGHIKCVYDGQYVTYYNENEEQIWRGARTLSNFQIRFSFNGEGSLKYKNFMIY